MDHKSNSVASLESIKHLLKGAHGIADNQKEISKLLGEHFNIFSILRMESKENATHSAFLGELLDPKGAHGMGTMFLNLFLKAINYQGDFKAEEGAKVSLEFYIGPRNEEKRTGGRIDIYLEDRHHTAISIENKIYAPEQPAQVERYSNHKAGKNTVYYLTLWGHAASKDSAGDLEAGVGYHTISYYKEVIDWLEACIKEAANQPILRETIRQYIILIQKLTHQLSDKKMENKIQDLIGHNYEAAKLIAANIAQAEMKAVKAFLVDLKKVIEETLQEGWVVTVSSDLNKDWAGLQIKYKDWNDSGTREHLVVTLQGQPKLVSGRSQYCIFAHESVWDRAQIMDSFGKGVFENRNVSSNEWCPFFMWPNLFESDEKKKRLFDPEARKVLLAWVSRDLIELAQAAEEPLKNAKRINKS